MARSRFCSDEPAAVTTSFSSGLQLDDEPLSRLQFSSFCILSFLKIQNINVFQVESFTIPDKNAIHAVIVCEQRALWIAAVHLLGVLRKEKQKHHETAHLLLPAIAKLYRSQVSPQNWYQRKLSFSTSETPCHLYFWNISMFRNGPYWYLQNGRVPDYNLQAQISCICPTRSLSKQHRDFTWKH